MKLVIAFAVLMTLLYLGFLRADDGFLPYQAAIHGQDIDRSVPFTPTKYALVPDGR